MTVGCLDGVSWRMHAAIDMCKTAGERQAPVSPMYLSPPAAAAASDESLHERTGQYLCA